MICAMQGPHSAWGGWATYITKYSDIRNNIRELMRIRNVRSFERFEWYTNGVQM
jgi:uncharacterized protein (UPF0297 family)